MPDKRKFCPKCGDELPSHGSDCTGFEPDPEREKQVDITLAAIAKGLKERDDLRYTLDGVQGQANKQLYELRAIQEWKKTAIDHLQAAMIRLRATTEDESLKLASEIGKFLRGNEEGSNGPGSEPGGTATAGSKVD